MVGHQRSLRVVEHDAFLAVEPALPLINFGYDGVQPECQNAVSQCPVGSIEGLSLPPKSVDQGGDLRAESRARSDDGGSLGLAIRDIAGRAAGEKIVEVLLRHGQELRDSVRHCGISSMRRDSYPLSAQLGLLGNAL